MSVSEMFVRASMAFSFGDIDRTYILYGVCLLFALLVLIIVIRVSVSRRAARRAASAAEAPSVSPTEEMPSSPVSEESVPTAVANEVAAEAMPTVSNVPDVSQASEEPKTSAPAQSRMRRAVQLPDVVGVHGAAELCPTEVVEEDGKLRIYCDVQVSVG